MRNPAIASILAAGLFLVHAADRERYVTGSAYGAGSGPSTGGPADHSVNVMLPGGVMLSSSGHCYAWTRSGRLVPVICP